MLKACEARNAIAKAIEAAIAIAAGVGFATSALAADIKATPPENSDDAAFIVIEGEIKTGDDNVFRKLAAEYSNAIVLLNSPGGMIGPAMDIGRTIKIRGYKTAIFKTGSCASACALIWVAGSKRVIFEGGQVGFHASYLDSDGSKLETGVGNALVGHYLSQLGFGEKTVVFATLAPPEKILWLNEKTASMSGIEFDTISDREDANRHQVAANRTELPAPRRRGNEGALESDVAGSERFMGDARQTFRNPDAIARALRQRGFQASVSYDDPDSPNLTTGVGGEEISVSFSGCDNKGCDYIQLLDFFNGMSRAEANAVIAHATNEEFYSHPIWVTKNDYLAFYNYIVIGSDGITAQGLIDNMTYFVKTNAELLQVAMNMRKTK